MMKSQKNDFRKNIGLVSFKKKKKKKNSIYKFKVSFNFRNVVFGVK